MQVSSQFYRQEFFGKTILSLWIFKIDSWGFYSVPLIMFLIFVPVAYCFDYQFLLECLEICYCDSSSYAFIISLALAIWVLLCFHMNCLISSSSGKNVVGILNGIMLSLLIAFGNMILLIQEMVNFLTYSILHFILFLSLVFYSLHHWNASHLWSGLLEVFKDPFHYLDDILCSWFLVCDTQTLV